MEFQLTVAEVCSVMKRKETSTHLLDFLLRATSETQLIVKNTCTMTAIISERWVER